jgi:hypothetical protein
MVTRNSLERSLPHHIDTLAKAAAVAHKVAGFPGIRASVIDQLSER